MSAERVFGTELQVSTKDQGLEVPTAVKNPKKRGKRYMTGYNLFMKENSRTSNAFPDTGEATLAKNAKLIAAAWRRIDKQTKKDWNELAQRQREDADCGLTTSMTSATKCDKCHKVFSRLTDKRYHQRNCSESKCVSCGAVFSTKLKLRQHENIHEELHKCQSCSKCFGTKQALDRHKATHSSVKSFQCTKCNQPFTLKTNLTRNMKKYHHKE